MENPSQSPLWGVTSLAQYLRQWVVGPGPDLVHQVSGPSGPSALDPWTASLPKTRQMLFGKPEPHFSELLASTQMHL